MSIQLGRAISPCPGPGTPHVHPVVCEVHRICLLCYRIVQCVLLRFVLLGVPSCDLSGDMGVLKAPVAFNLWLFLVVLADL